MYAPELNVCMWEEGILNSEYYKWTDIVQNPIYQYSTPK